MPSGHRGACQDLSQSLVQDEAALLAVTNGLVSRWQGLCCKSKRHNVKTLFRFGIAVAVNFSSRRAPVQQPPIRWFETIRIDQNTYAAVPSSIYATRFEGLLFMDIVFAPRR